MKKTHLVKLQPQENRRPVFYVDHFCGLVNWTIWLHQATRLTQTDAAVLMVDLQRRIDSRVHVVRFGEELYLPE